MKESIEFSKFIFEQENPWVIISAVILAVIFTIPYLLKLLKEISTISHTIEIKNIEGFSSSINEENSSAAKYKLEKYFAQLYKRSFTYKEIKYLLSFESPSTAIKDYIWGFSYLKFEDNKINYRKNYWLKTIRWSNGILFMLSSLCGVVSFLILIAVLMAGANGELLFNLICVVFYMYFIAWLTLKGGRDVNAACRVVEKQPKKLTKTQKTQQR
ncbi:hypothetical protein Sbal223_0744 [Shewanella baltica OS223]|uniref:hypothetical protein n=1 Tax=Shewanella baltica TaxID=62322 RepID=UPI0001883D4D|nr:hypothetical protein [Shewanella baltica]ACK45263.1 hypothetical protein Sbal223_0744 [Shewanella baltica OS223]